MIVLGSRYQDEAIIATPLPTGEVRQSVFRTSTLNETGNRYHVWRSSDRPDQVSEKFLGNGDQWWRIMDLNPEVLDPFNIEPGTLLTIPSA